MFECKATDKDDATEDQRFGRIGKQTIKDTGPLNRERMTTVEDNFLARSGFPQRQSPIDVDVNAMMSVMAAAAKVRGGN